MEIKVGDEGGRRQGNPMNGKEIEALQFHRTRTPNAHLHTYAHPLSLARSLSISLAYTHIHTHTTTHSHIQTTHSLTPTLSHNLCLSHSQTLTRKHTCKSYTCAPHQQPWTKPCERTPTNTRSVKHKHSRHVNEEKGAIHVGKIHFYPLHSLHCMSITEAKQRMVIGHNVLFDSRLDHQTHLQQP